MAIPRPVLALVILSLPAVARASGGAHVVDDSEVETPGWCHLELWGSDYRPGGSLFNVGPACTPKAVPWLELDGFATRTDQRHGRATTTIGFGPKVTLRPQSSGLGVGLSGLVAIDPRDGRVASAAFNLPVTRPIGPRWRINANVGLCWVRGSGRAALTAGGQAEYTPAHGPELMAEVFRTGNGPLGAQAGPRWTVDRGRVDIDLLAARYPDGVAKAALTLGMTIRR